ncbi:protein PTCD3 homolog, mitochondrial [Patella vulgata]|uniref:protein PTCD3 homolog, mitochondrial n=1 Tax=Patella vulgata TaxID=6465 RepID=UPI00217F4665|nr:protein PTCD3 homolog, mitochondrial [Patella vulgata]
MATSMKSIRKVILWNLSKKSRHFSSCQNHCNRHETEQLKQEPAKLSGSTSEIVIPNRIPRGPTSILKALASTVERDPNAPAYYLIDDPYLYPTGFIQKRNYALSKAAGKRAAKHIVEQHPEFFQNDTSQPKVEAFMPPKTEYQTTGANEEALIERIQMKNVKDAIALYKEIQLEEMEISEETLLDLLDLLCVYNNKDPPEELYGEEFIYLSKHDRKPAKTWEDFTAAEKLFEDLPRKSARAYNTIVTGMAKGLASENAMNRYNEMLENMIPVDLETFNHLIEYGTMTTDSHKEKWSLVTGMLQELKNQGLQPTLETFRCVLSALATMASHQNSPHYVMKTLAEMKKLGIEPSLSCFANVLDVFYNKSNDRSDMLKKIVEYIWEKKIPINGSDDLHFFFLAMMKNSRTLKDVEIATKLEILARKYDVISGPVKYVSVFYSLYFKLLCMYDTIEHVIEVYNRIVPHIWMLNTEEYDELFKAIELYEGYQYIPQIWSDMQFDLMKLNDVVNLVVSSMAKVKHKEQLQNQFCEIAESLISRWISDQQFISTMRPPRRYLGLTLTATGMGDLITISCNGNRFDQAWLIFSTIKDNPNSFEGVPSGPAFTNLVELCIQNNKPEQAIDVVVYMCDHGLSDAKASIEKIQTQMSLTDSQKEGLGRLVN